MAERIIDTLYARLHQLSMAAVEHVLYGFRGFHRRNADIEYIGYSETLCLDELLLNDTSEWPGFVTQVYDFANQSEDIERHGHHLHIRLECKLYGDHTVRLESALLSVVLEWDTGRLLEKTFRRSRMRRKMVNNKLTVYSECTRYDTDVETFPDWQRRLVDAAWRRARGLAR